MQSSSSEESSLVRLARREDVPFVWEMILELAEYERLSHKVTGNALDVERFAFDEGLVEIYVVEEAARLVGFTLTYKTFSTFLTQPGIWLEDLYVKPDCRGKGYGKALLRNLMDQCKANGCGRLEWSVLDWNEPSIRFYEAMGATILPDWKICRVTF
jgi:GNAT superfamily N-acetyltransferase